MKPLHIVVMILGLLWAPVTHAQVFNSGSSGVDGALSFVCASPQVIDWDPAGLDVDADGVFEFSTINVGTDCTVRLLATMVGFQSVVWLASGAVVIDGTLDLNGGTGHPGTNGLRVTALPGPGGFSGGLGALNGSGVTTAGFGPGGGSAGGTGGGGGGHFSGGGSGAGVPGGAAYGNNFLRPLIGGSGGGGGSIAGGGGGGGGGAGALLVASTVSISVDGQIHADGGGGSGSAGGGSGGAIRLVAPQVVGVGSITTSSGSPGNGFGGPGSKGRLRIESDNLSFAGSLQTGEIVSVSLLPNTPLVDSPSIVPSLRIATVDGLPTPVIPTGSFSPVDVTVDTATAVTVVIESTNVPAGTIVTVEVHNQTTGTQTFSSDPLAGASDPLSANANNVVIDAGLSTILVRANF